MARGLAERRNSTALPSGVGCGLDGPAEHEAARLGVLAEVVGVQRRFLGGIRPRAASGTMTASRRETGPGRSMGVRGKIAGAGARGKVEPSAYGPAALAVGP